MGNEKQDLLDLREKMTALEKKLSDMQIDGTSFAIEDRLDQHLGGNRLTAYVNEMLWPIFVEIEKRIPELG